MYKLKMITIGLVLVETLFVFNPGLLVLRGGAIYTSYNNILVVVFGANSMEYKPIEIIRI